MVQSRRYSWLAFVLILFAVMVFPQGAHGYKAPGGYSINGDQEILADPARPVIYWAHPLGNSLSFVDAFTGSVISTITVGPGPMSVDLSLNGSWLYVGVSGANQTTVINVTSRTIARTLPLPFSPLSVRAGRGDRLYISGAQDGIVRIVNETTGAAIDQVTPLSDTFRALLEISPNKTVLLAHLLSDPVKIYKYDIASDRLVFLVVDNHDLGQNFRQMTVDWTAGLIYLVPGTAYGIELVSVSTLARLGWLPMWAYPAGVALIRDRHIVIGIHRDYYDAALWVFNTTTRAQIAKVPIPVSPPGYAPEESLMVASEAAGTVLLWTEGELRVLTTDPSIFPGSPGPGREVVGFPAFYVTARVWRGLIEPASNTTTISLDGTALNGFYDVSQDVLRAAAPVLPVGRHQITAEIAWPDGSKSVTWNFTVTSPPPVATFVVLGSKPLLSKQPIEFDARNSTALGTIIAFVWDFGDGSTASGDRVTHVFAAPGAYRVLLSIATNLNVSDSLARQVVIEAAPEPPPTAPSYVVAIVGIGSTLAASLVVGLAVVFLRRRRRSGSLPEPDTESKRK